MVLREEDTYLEKKKFHVLLLRVSAAHKKRCRQRFQGLGLTEGQPKILSCLLETEGCLQKELAELCHVEQATMTSLLRNMQQAGLIEKKRESIGGKRAYRIFLTEQGKCLGKQVNRIVDEVEQECFSKFRAEQKETFLRMFSLISEHLEQTGKGGAEE